MDPFIHSFTGVILIIIVLGITLKYFNIPYVVAYIIAGIIIGGLIGLILARSVKMTAMPELVAVFNGFGGGASVLVALAYFIPRSLDDYTQQPVKDSVPFGHVSNLKILDPKKFRTQIEGD